MHKNIYRTSWRRVLAGLIDALVFLPIGLLNDYLFASERSAPALLIWGTTYYSSLWLYSVLLHAKYGKTIGKLVMGISVLDISEQRNPTLRQAFIRDIIYILLNVFWLIYFIYLVVAGSYTYGVVERNGPGQVMLWASAGWFVLEILTMLTNSKRRAIHDFLAGTVVVKDA